MQRKTKVLSKGRPANFAKVSRCSDCNLPEYFGLHERVFLKEGGPCEFPLNFFKRKIITAAGRVA